MNSIAKIIEECIIPHPCASNAPDVHPEGGEVDRTMALLRQEQLGHALMEKGVNFTRVLRGGSLSVMGDQMSEVLQDLTPWHFMGLLAILKDMGKELSAPPTTFRLRGEAPRNIRPRQSIPPVVIPPAPPRLGLLYTTEQYVATFFE